MPYFLVTTLYPRSASTYHFALLSFASWSQQTNCFPLDLACLWIMLEVRTFDVFYPKAMATPTATPTSTATRTATAAPMTGMVHCSCLPVLTVLAFHLVLFCSLPGYGSLHFEIMCLSIHHAVSHVRPVAGHSFVWTVHTPNWMTPNLFFIPPQPCTVTDAARGPHPQPRALGQGEDVEYGRSMVASRPPFHFPQCANTIVSGMG